MGFEGFAIELYKPPKSAGQTLRDTDRSKSLRRSRVALPSLATCRTLERVHVAPSALSQFRPTHNSPSVSPWSPRRGQSFIIDRGCGKEKSQCTLSGRLTVPYKEEIFYHIYAKWTAIVLSVIDANIAVSDPVEPLRMLYSALPPCSINLVDLLVHPS